NNERCILRGDEIAVDVESDTCARAYHAGVAIIDRRKREFAVRSPPTVVTEIFALPPMWPPLKLSISASKKPPVEMLAALTLSVASPPMVPGPLPLPSSLFKL